MPNKIKLFSDGGARGNPGPAAIGIVIKDDNNKVIKEASAYLGPATNNQAEYQALIKGLEIAKQIKATEVHCFLDSELIVRQMNQEYKVKDKELQRLFVQVWNLALGFKKVTYTHIGRELNKEADKLVNQQLDKHS